jgi:N-methylhydantoinase A/oxoprolinase/acetone carboxylase beta subunit
LAPDLLGGAFTLDPEAARRAIVTRVTAPMGLALDDATRVIRAIADNHMTGAIPIVSVERVLRDQTG